MALSERDYRRGTRNRIKGPGTGTSDDIPAMLSNGEFVVKASSAAKIGDKALNHMNRTGRVPMGPMMQQMKQGRMRGKRRVKMGVGGLISKLGVGAAALYGGKKIQDRFTTPTHNKDLAAASEGGSGGGALAPSAPVSPNPNYGGVATPSNQGATNALEERIRRAGGAKGGYVIRRKKMNLGGAAKAAGWITVAALTGYAGKKGIEAVQRLNKERKEKMKEVEAATPEKKYGGGYAWPRKQMMHGGKVMSVKPGRGVISTTGRDRTDDREDGYTTYGYERGGAVRGKAGAAIRLAKAATAFRPNRKAAFLTGVGTGAVAQGTQNDRLKEVAAEAQKQAEERRKRSQVPTESPPNMSTQPPIAYGLPRKGLRATTGMAGGGHPGFKAVQAKIARKSGVPMKNAGAILAAASRRASPAAKRANPRLNRVKG